MDTKDLFESLDVNNNGNIEPTEIDDSLKGKIVSFYDFVISFSKNSLAQIIIKMIN